MIKSLKLKFIPDDLFSSADYNFSLFSDDSYLVDYCDHGIIVCFDDFDDFDEE